MISVGGASLIAQVIPVGLLIVAVEARAAGPIAKEPGRWGGAKWFALVLSLAGVVLFSLIAIAYCVVAVSSNQPISGYAAFCVYAALVGLGYAVFVTLLRLLSVSIVGPQSVKAVRAADARRALVRHRASRVAALSKAAAQAARRSARSSRRRAIVRGFRRRFVDLSRLLLPPRT